MRLHGRWFPLAAASLLALATLACTVALFDAPGTTTDDSDTPGDPNVSGPNQAGPVASGIVIEGDTEESLLINIYQHAAPAVVNIDVSANDDQGELSDFGSGSGFVIDTEGHIVTNNHVIADADEVRVTFNDGRVYSAEILGSDQYADIAVLQVDVPDDYQLTTIELGDSSTLQVGQRVIAIGNPFGLTGSMTVGIISAVGRTLPSQVITSTGIFSNPLIIQTDAAINPGNSGGPLLDSSGRVIGITAAIRSQTGVNSGIGFAIPVNTVKRVVPQIIETGEVQYPYLGISANANITLTELATEYDLPVSEGVLIQSVSPGSGAAEAGLRGGTDEEVLHGQRVLLGGDIITAIDGVAIANFDQLLGYLVSNTSVGQTITVTIVRDGETQDVEVTLGARPE